MHDERLKKTHIYNNAKHSKMKTNKQIKNEKKTNKNSSPSSVRLFVPDTAKSWMSRWTNRRKLSPKTRRTRKSPTHRKLVTAKRVNGMKVKRKALGKTNPLNQLQNKANPKSVQHRFEPFCPLPLFAVIFFSAVLFVSLFLFVDCLLLLLCVFR